MKLVHALPLLSASASIMALGLYSYASAQPPLPAAVPNPAPAPATPDAPREPAAFATGLEGTDTRTTPPGARVSFNLEDADLPDLVRIVARISGKRFILPSKAPRLSASVYSPTDVTVAEAYRAFLSILDMNGLTVEPSGRYFKIVETTGAAGRAHPIVPDGEAMPEGDRFVTRLHRIAHVDVADVATLLEHFRGPDGAIVAYAPTNTLMITDTAPHVERMLEIVSHVDVERTGESIWIEPVHFAVATDLLETLTAMFPVDAESGAASTPSPAGRGKAPVTREGEPSGSVGVAHGAVHVTNILADERTNAILIQATERAYLQILEAIRVLDVAVEDEGSVHVYELQYADAENVAEVLSSLVSGGGGGGHGGGPSGGPGEAASITSGAVSIQSYDESNALLITASQSDFAGLRRVLEQLDVAPRQVFIEAVIMELSVQRTGRLGLSYHGGIQDPSTSDGNGLSLLGFGAAESLGIGTASMLTGDTLSGLALGVRGPSVTTATGLSIPSFGVMLTAMATSSDVDVLSTPHLLAMNNVEAEITVGSNIPLQQNGGLGSSSLASLAGLAGATGTSTSATSALGALSGLTGSTGGLGGSGGRQSVGTTIRITPHINDEGEIRLEIEEEISEAGAAQGTLGVVPISQRIAKTQVLVRDQETVVIGGLMRDRITTTEEKIPILGDIPILGALFRRETRTSEKTNLLMFLTPYVIRSPDDLRTIFERKMRERQEFLDRYFVFGDHEYEPAIDYSRTRGLVTEIFDELDHIDEERAFAEALAESPPPDHRARAPLGEAEPYDPEDGGLVITPDDFGTVIPAGLTPEQP